MKVIGGVCLQFEWQYGQGGENMVLWFTALTSNFFLYQPPIILVECEVIHLDQNSKRIWICVLYIFNSEFEQFYISETESFDARKLLMKPKHNWCKSYA